MELSTPISAIPGIGYYFRKKLEILGILTIQDLIYHVPFRYDDFSQQSSVIEANIDEKVTLKGEIWQIQNIYTRNRKLMTKAIFNDGTAPIDITWFNQAWLIKNIKAGDKLQISGKLTKFKNRYSIVSPVWEKISSTDLEQPANTLHTGRLVPVYPETDGLTSKWLRAKVAVVLPKIIGQIKDPIPRELTSDYFTLPEALTKIHFPETLKDATLARKRLAFDELFFTQITSQKTKLEWKNRPTTKAFAINEQKLTAFYGTLPFKLTDSQLKVIREIIHDLEKSQPMNRLVQGEVGSGKTVVAAVIAYVSYLNGLKSLFMAPTEILAFQHYQTMKRLLEPQGITTGLYTGSKKFTKEQVEHPDIVVGTHALLSEKFMTDDVGLVVVDEQQRFGVKQRSVLRTKAKVPHFLTMTATPIPRTIALTLYGELDLSIIDQLPSGRQAIITRVVPSKKRTDAYGFVEKKVKEGDQVYIITPLIEESETLVSAKAALTEFETLKNEIFPHLRLGLLHGRLKPAEKDRVLQDFKNGGIDILVSTSVVEVGVDVPNATIMIIESAERFGLAQLHQLRGRVGRGSKQSYCFLFTQIEESAVIRRLKNLETINNGLKLAELDLRIRGSGELFGTHQSGRFELKFADFSDLELIEKARFAAEKILQEDITLDKYPLIRGKLQSLTGNIMPD